ncbi:hypothetical protein ACICHK_43270 (plasmid) [Streptomyces sp. AHU1]|uniref:hypothetical protein n=1 Tax=Streptomyces sp. AHU1 TaxID=3377215 RepID=UPI00387809EF
MNPLVSEVSEGSFRQSMSRHGEQNAPKPMKGFASFLRQDLDAVTAGLSLPWSSEVVEGHANRSKTLSKLDHEACAHISSAYLAYHPQADCALSPEQVEALDFEDAQVLDLVDHGDPHGGAVLPQVCALHSVSQSGQ